MNQIIHTEEDRSAGSVGGANAPVSSLRPRRGDPAILVFSQRPAAAHSAAEEAISPDWEVPPTIGEMAVRLIAEWSLPRMRMLPASREGDAGSA